jgi:hypothetical protein
MAVQKRPYTPDEQKSLPKNNWLPFGGFGWIRNGFLGVGCDLPDSIDDPAEQPGAGDLVKSVRKQTACLLSATRRCPLSKCTSDPWTTLFAGSP